MITEGKLEFVNLNDISFGTRRREDYGAVDDLAKSIEERGLIHPIAVQSDNGNPPYILAAGGRRYLACKLLGRVEIACRIYDHPLSNLELKAIELFENIDRKDLTPQEDCNLKRDIHNLMLEIHGKKVSTIPGAQGWSMRDTANALGKSVSTISEDIKIAEAAEKMPHLELGNCKTKKEALKTIEHFEQTLVRGELAKRAEKELGTDNSRLAKAYIVGDFFEQVKNVPSGTIDLIEIDPPYAIKLQEIKKSDTSYKANYGESYNEVSTNYYPEFITNVLKECYRVAKPNAWLLMWFGPEPWFEDMWGMLNDGGFRCRRLPALWTKGEQPGQCFQPSIYLGNSYEMFFYARKGDATIKRQGRKAQYDHAPVNPANKVHPTERPVELMEDILSTFAWEGARVLVPFAGSGNTLIAAANLKMLPIGYDLSEEYRDAYVSRLMGKEINNDRVPQD
uniref:Putative methyltransferase n=1 Tax=viral metagenome TaxID=1070528 RepID=A0A6H1ZPS5_9ZZZZ